MYRQPNNQPIFKLKFPNKEFFGVDGCLQGLLDTIDTYCIDHYIRS